jgi:hypothetical protein
MEKTTLDDLTTTDLKGEVKRITHWTRNGLPEYIKAPLRYDRKRLGHELDYRRAQSKHETGNWN